MPEVPVATPEDVCRGHLCVCGMRTVFTGIVNGCNNIHGFGHVYVCTSRLIQTCPECDRSLWRREHPFLRNLQVVSAERELVPYFTGVYEPSAPTEPPVPRGMVCRCQACGY